MNWERLFKPHILERGMAYYYEGCVEDLEINEDEITAVVEGTEQYDVSIELDEDDVSGMECTCPYAEDGENCKHMAAVLYAWQGKKTGSRGADAQIREAVERADEALVRRFLADALLRDDRLWRRFMIEVQPDGAPFILDDVEAAVDAIVDKYMADGYIDYYEADNFVSELLDI
ncbi:MAG: SWIM zinc finger family protein, partial [Clostridia bacterium]|nr:SWIM zinc finger family protein [Clostridia bacterium]